LANDPYKELGVSRSASADDIRKAFRKLAKELHPDRNPGDKKSEERFKRVSAAFDLLGDEQKRKRFDAGEIDADGHEIFRGFGGGRPGAGAGGFQQGFGGGAGHGFGGRFEGLDLDEIFEMFGSRGAGAGAGAGAGGPGGGFPGRGADVRSRMEIDLEDAIRGAVKRVSFPDGRTLDVTIPKGATEGQVLRLKGQGAQGRGVAGDALVELVIRPHPVFRREGADLHMDVPVSVPDAVLGGKVEAPTPEGPVALNVPKGSNSGTVLRLKGRGAADLRTGRRGDLFAKLVVTLPDRSDPKLEAFAEEWRRERPYGPKRRP